MCEDRHMRFLFLTQKISQLAHVINDGVARDEFEKVSIAGLYQSTTNPRFKTEKWVKHRWKIHSVLIDDAPCFYESMRKNGYENCTLLGNPAKYGIAH